MAMQIDVGMLSGSLIYAIIILAIIGLFLAPTLGGAIVWGLALLIGAFVAFVLLRRLYLRAVGRRGGSR